MDTVTLSAADLALAGLAAVAAGVVNALAGGGTLITFPTLTALGLPAVAANVTNTVAVAPGHLGATLAQRRELTGQRARLRRLVPAALLGGLVGGLLLLFTTERVFRRLVPFLILFASAILAVQEPVRRWLLRRLGTHDAAHDGSTPGRSTSTNSVRLAIGTRCLVGEILRHRGPAE